MTKLIKMLMGLVFAVIALICLFIFSLPSILSTSWGTKYAVDQINRNIPGSLEIEQLDLNWLGSQKIEGFLLKDPKGKTIVEVKKLMSGATLWQLLKSHASLKEVSLEDFNAVISTDKNGLTNLAWAFGKQKNSTPFVEDTLPIILSHVNAKGMIFVPDQPLVGEITGNTLQGHLNGSFMVNFSLNRFHLTDWEAFKKHAEKFLKLEAKIENFPIDLVDRIASLKNPQLAHFFHSLLGDRLNLNLNKRPSKEGVSFHLELATPLMHGDINGQIQQNILFFEAPAHIQLDLAPGSIGKNFILDKAGVLNVSFKQLRIPLDNPLDTAIELEAALSNLNISNNGKGEGMTLRDIALTVDGTALSRLVTHMSGKLSFLLDSPFSSLIEEPLKFEQHSNWNVLANGTVEMKSGELQFINSNAQIDLPFKITSDHVFIMMGPLEGKYVLTPKTFEALKKKNSLEALILEKSVPFNFNIEPTEFDLKPSNMHTDISIHIIALPASILNTTGQIDFTKIIGPSFNIDFKTSIDPSKKDATFSTFNLSSLNFNAEGGLKIENSVLTADPQKPPKFKLKITPESYRYLNVFGQQEERILNSPIEIDLIFSKFSTPLNPLLNEKKIFDVQLTTSPIIWKNLSNSEWKLKANFSSQDWTKQISFSAIADSKRPLKLEGEVSHLFDQSGNISALQEIEMVAAMSGKQVTPELLQDIFQMNAEQKQKLLAVFGDALDLKATCRLKNLSGPLNVSIDSSNGHIHLDGTLQQGVLFLNRPFEASVKITPQLSRAFFAPNVSLLSTVSDAETPLTFKIEPTQFHCPLIPFQMEKVKIGKATLNLGKVNFKNEGELRSILGLIGPLSGDRLTIWFTPIYLEQNNGILSLQRFDMLIANAYTLANWGWVNLMTHEAAFDLGLPANTLEYAFGIQGLDEKYMLQVPFASASGKIEIDKKKAMARISALLAQTHGGSKGKLLGSLFDIAVSGKEEPYPPPTTQPFPWAGEFSPIPKKVDSAVKAEANNKPSDETTQDSTDEKKNKKNKKNKKKKFLNIDSEEIQKGANHILDHFFGQ